MRWQLRLLSPSCGASQNRPIPEPSGSQKLSAMMSQGRGGLVERSDTGEKVAVCCFGIGFFVPLQASFVCLFVLAPTFSPQASFSIVCFAFLFLVEGPEAWS